MPSAEKRNNWYVLLAGLLPPTSDLALGPGLSLRPLTVELSVFDLAAVGAVGFREWAALEPFASAVRCEIESSVDGAAPPGYDTLNRAWLANALLVLRGYASVQAIACSGYTWNMIAGYQARSSEAVKKDFRERGVDAVNNPLPIDLPRFQGMVLDYHFRIFAGRDAKRGPVSDEDAKWINEHFEAFNRLCSDSESFRLALECAVDWRYTKEPRSAIARIWSGIEALFGIQSELVFRISALSAGLLAPRGIERRQRFAAVKKLYGVRSKAVHGDRLSEVDLGKAVVDSFDLLRELLLQAISRGHMLGTDDFDAALFD